MKLNVKIGLILFVCSISLKAQTIITTPVVGAVTDSSALILFLDTSYYEGNTYIELDGIVEGFAFSNDIYSVNLTKLRPNTEYKYLIYRYVSPLSKYLIGFGKFKTFPKINSDNPFAFTFGSCTEQRHNDSIFIEMQKHKPLFFMHIGDWLYSDNFKKGDFHFLKSKEHLKQLYQQRYSMPSLSKLMQQTALDYIFDDEDGVHDDFSAMSFTEIQRQNSQLEIKEISYDTVYKQNLYAGLKSYFPSYPEVNEKQAYHSFVCGNAEFFVLDTRSTRSPNSEVFYKHGAYWRYKAPDNHVILNAAQLNWLKEKLLHSKAQWKFIVSSVTFNPSYKKVLDIMMLRRVQNRNLPNGMTGAYVAVSLSSMWFAFPETQTELVNFCADNKIKNVIVLSGDAHTAAIDDGRNAAFPELMAASLAQENSKLAGIIFNNLKMNLWNKGGQGIGNSNYNDAFGKVTINGNTSVTLAAIDKYGNVICSYDVQDGFIPQKMKIKKAGKITLGNKIRAAKQALKIRR